MQEFYQTDLESVKEQLVEFLGRQDELKDFNFEGSAITELLNLFAYTIQYQNLYLNFNSSELFMNTAELEDNVYKIANTLNYIPKRKSAAYIEVQLQRTEAVTIVIPKYSTWTLGSLNLTNLDDITINDGSIYAVRLYEGTMETETFVSDGTDFQTYDLSEREDIDDENIFVYVDEPDGAGGYIVSTVEWENINTEPIDVGGKGYYIHYFDVMKIKFDNGNLYEKPGVDDRVRVIYLKTSGSTVNGSTGTITLTDTSVANRDKMTATPTTTLKNGTDEESVDAIKTRAPQYYTTLNRAITESDYNILLKKYPSYDTFHSGIIWGGEKEYVDQNGLLQETTPTKDLGHIYISALKSDYAHLDSTEQSDLEAYLEKFKIITLFFEYMYPSIVNVTPTVSISYESTLDLDLTSVEDQINEYLAAKDGFGKSFYLSDLVRFVDDLSDVVYTTVTYATSVTVYNETHKVVRLGNAVTPSSIGGMINGFAISDDGAGNLTWNATGVGIINYSTGFITLDQDFGVSSYDITFTYADQSNLSFEKETFLKHGDITLNIL